MRTIPRLASLAALGAALAGCQSADGLTTSAFSGGPARTSSVSVDYYPIAGNSIQALDTQIKAKGPKIGHNRHAVAVARIAMQPKMTYRQGRAGCSVASANVSVNARVTLPAWTGRAEAGPALGAKWDNIDRYTRLHEAVHVAVAFRHARALEARLISLPPRASCATARSRALAVARKALKAHDRAQRRFDRSEARRIAALRASSLHRTDNFGEPEVPKGLGLPRPLAGAARGNASFTMSGKPEAALRDT